MPHLYQSVASVPLSIGYILVVETPLLMHCDDYFTYLLSTSFVFVPNPFHKHFC